MKRDRRRTSERISKGENRAQYQTAGFRAGWKGWGWQHHPSPDRRVRAGKTYVPIHERKSSPYGYAIAKDVEFTVEIPKGTKRRNEGWAGIRQLKRNKAGEIFMATDTGQTELYSSFSNLGEIKSVKFNGIGCCTRYYNRQSHLLQSWWKSSDFRIRLMQDTILIAPCRTILLSWNKSSSWLSCRYRKTLFRGKDNQINEIQTITSTLKMNVQRLISIWQVLEEQKLKIRMFIKISYSGLLCKRRYLQLQRRYIPYITLVYTSGNY